MGLLDGFNDPTTVGLLSAAATMFDRSNSVGHKNSLGQILSGGLLGGMQGYQGTQDAIAMRKLQDMKAQNYGMELEKSKLELGEAQRKTELEKAIAEAARASMISPEAQALAGGGGPTPANAAKIGDMTGGFDQARFIDSVMALDPVRGLALKKDFAKQAEEFHGTPQVGLDPATNQPFTYLVGKHGSQKRLDGTLPRDKLETVDLGGKVVLRSPYSTEIAGSFGKTLSPGEAASNAVARANLGLSAERLALERSNQGKPQFNAEMGGFVTPPTAQNPSGGFIPLAGGASKPLTEGQGKALNFTARMQNADSIASEIIASGVKTPSFIRQTAEKVPFIGGSLGKSANFIASEPQQKLEQAQRDFISAVLRLESGAVIGEEEYESAKKQYFPEFGDSDAVISQKAKNRAIAINGMKTMAGPGAARIDSVTNVVGGAKTGPSIDALLKKYGG